MIEHFSVLLQPSAAGKEQKLNGYQLYGCLLEMLPSETAEWLHENSRTPISQNIIACPAENGFLWEINVFEEDLAAEISEALVKTKEFYAQKADILLKINRVDLQSIKNFSDIRSRSAALMEKKNIRLNFLTATALKQNGEFLLFPDMELILKNLWNSWNTIFPETPFDDEDALRLLVRGTYITSNQLSSSIYRMKGNNIRGFYGNIIIGSRLSEPMKELLYALLMLSEYSGTGVKTTLGMGKTAIQLS